jgi:acetyl-CoA synthetase
MFESIPTYPSPSRYWDVIDRHQITQLYTAPTAIRTLMVNGLDYLKNYKGDSLRVLGSVGEPINPAAWKWYFENVGKSRCPIVDTYWQTETGGIIISPIPGVTNELKPGAAMVPFFGIQPEILNDKGVPQTGNNVTGILAIKSAWPGIARTVFGDHDRYMETYLRPYLHYYFTGDGCIRDADGHIWITGRVDDVINKAGHRIGSAEIESALVSYPACAEAAVITIPDEIMGEKIIAYCTLKEDYEESDGLILELKQSVATEIGKFAVPDRIILTSLLPKTRSGKIMRRILRKVILGQISDEEIGDISTLAEPDSIKKLIQKVHPKKSSL